MLIKFYVPDWRLVKPNWWNLKNTITRKYIVNPQNIKPD